MTSDTSLLGLGVAVIVAAAAYVYFGPCKERKVLRADKFQKFPLIQKVVLSHNSAVYRFGLPRHTDVLGLPIGQHISIGAEINGKEVVRSYTPISTDEEKGYFDLLIKVYENGLITRYVDNLKIGDHLQVRGPKGFFTYTPNMMKEFGMVAGGTGITPMYQIITEIARNPDDNTKVTLIYGNVTENDILLRAELDLIAQENPNIKIHHVLNNPPEKWQGGVGYITQDILESKLPKPSPDTQLLLCGPPPMTSAMKKAAVELGYKKAKPVSKLGDQIFVF